MELFGTDLYHLIAAFIVYSMLGWLVESVYMSFCNKELTNRGFTKSPFCPIYGFGAVAGYLVLSPLGGQYMKLYVTGAFLATVFEYLVGKLMIHIFGELWWDYHNKPFNFRGIICLESTVAWGFYALIVVTFLHQRIYELIDGVPYTVGSRMIVVILAVVAIDFSVQLLHALKVDIKEKRAWLIEQCHLFKARWY
jgi:uncharacterized membrane protein